MNLWPWLIAVISVVIIYKNRDKHSHQGLLGMIIGLIISAIVIFIFKRTVTIFIPGMLLGYAVGMCIAKE